MEIFMTVKKLNVPWYGMNGRWNVFSALGSKQQRYVLSGTTGKGKSWVGAGKIRTVNTTTFGTSWCLMSAGRWLWGLVCTCDPWSQVLSCCHLHCCCSTVATRHCSKPRASRGDPAGRAVQQLLLKATPVKQSQFTHLVLPHSTVREMSWSEESIHAQDLIQRLSLDMNNQYWQKSEQPAVRLENHRESWVGGTHDVQLLAPHPKNRTTSPRV